MRRWVVQVGLLLLWLTPCGAVAQDYPRYRAVGSTYVPLDSWVYPAFERLAAQGYVQTAMLGMKPWTRFECARLVDEAEEILRTRVLEDQRVEEQAAQAVEALGREFTYELDLLGGGPHHTARLESLYTRVTSISGPPLTDGLHFGQTIAGDFGRPFRRGTNVIAGGSVRMEYGLVAAHIQAEYLHSPSAPALADSVLDLIARLDGKPRNPATPFAAMDRPNLLESYVAFNLRNWQISIGRQSLSWGVGGGESLLMSNNAQPLDMLRITRVVPQKWPWFLKHLGPLRTEFFVSRLEGLTLVPRPYFYGQKISFKMHPRLEIGYGRTSLIGGGSFDISFGTLLRNFFGIRDKSIGTNPGDSRTAVDFAWNMPWIGDSLTLYAELFQDDEPLYFINPKKGIVRAGLFFTRLPGLPQMDFRIEATNSESSNDDGNGNRNYLNFQYRDGYVNRGFLMGNPVGRDGRNVQVWTRYWLSPASVIEGRFKHSSVSPDFLPGGALWEDYAIGHRLNFRSGLYLKNSLQFEHIRKFPSLFQGAQKNVTLAVEIGFQGWERQP